MGAFDGPIVKTGNTERATVADPATKDFPSVPEIITVLPDHLGHVAEMARFAIEQSERDEPADSAGASFLELVRGHW